MANIEQLLEQEGQSIKKSLTSLLKDEEIQGVAIISSDGTILSEILPENIDKEKFGTIIATLIGSSSIVMKQLTNEDLEKVIINALNGKVVIMQIDNSLISVIIGKDADMNRVNKEIEELSENLKKVSYEGEKYRNKKGRD